jgi:hypothetical protein
LSADTWPDFEKLFSRGNGWDHCWCIGFQRVQKASRTVFRTRAEVSVVNYQKKQELVDAGRAHGILVYANGETVGRCQYGSSDELNGRGGVAGVALRAALDSIRQHGGGVVEAYPVACWTHGPTRSEGPVYVQGVGPVAPEWGGFGNVSTSCVVSMFEKEGFQATEVCEESRSARVQAHGAVGCHVLMRKVV